MTLCLWNVIAAIISRIPIAPPSCWINVRNHKICLNFECQLILNFSKHLFHFLWNSVIFARTCFIFEEFGNVVRPSVRCHLVIFNITIAVYAAAAAVVFFLHLFLSTCFIVSSYLLHANHTLYGVWCLEWIPEGRLMVGCLLG